MALENTGSHCNRSLQVMKYELIRQNPQHLCHLHVDHFHPDWRRQDRVPDVKTRKCQGGNLAGLLRYLNYTHYKPATTGTIAVIFLTMR